uniref:Uncharacterized protein n=1 Tax=Utricularia reniformis TaxID=192314 RepID=A0A1Y0AZ60_9LAMI|nr:hypothetical protein AEK19_MT1940 [Utricularia reniformis]ART30418.1 hypothetical protein AEK19_MT1940 [Utricularia reniformis]
MLQCLKRKTNLIKKNGYLSAGAEQSAGLDHYKTKSGLSSPTQRFEKQRAVHLEFSLPVVYSKRARV